MIRALYAVAIFLGSFLLFWLQPLISKMALPVFGGSPQVWNTCLVFFQVTLLLGYLFAHFLAVRVPFRAQVFVASVIIALGLFFSPPDAFAARFGDVGSEAALGLLVLLSFSIGPAFFPLSANAPLLQSWFDRRRRRGEDPYALYAASNAGSLLALLSFPFLLEPRFAIRDQIHAWTYGYAAWLLLVIACGLVARRDGALRGAEAERSEEARDVGRTFDEPLSLRRRLGWMGLAFLPSSLLMGVTTHISTDIAAIPLLWILPLAIYLVTFIVAFAARSERVEAAASRYFPLLALPLVVWLGGGATAQTMPWVPILLHIAVFALAAQFCHARLAASRPSPSRLTAFYIDLSLGGALGGVFNALIAPRIFNDVWEYPMALGAACFLVPLRAAPARKIGISDLAFPVLVVALLFGLDRSFTYYAPELDKEKNFIVFGVPAVVCLLGARTRIRFGLCALVLLIVGVAYQYPSRDVALRARSFFGVYKVLRDPTVPYISLTHGSTTHGGQWRDPRLEAEPQTYYHPAGPMGHIYHVFASRDTSSPVAAVGLGTGSMAAYAEPRRTMTFFEIDPLMMAIARDTSLFTYLAKSRGRIEIDLGDARLRLATRNERFGLLVLDAFSSDAIPVHLMTIEAVRLYFDRLADSGIIAFHVSNRFLDLVPVLASIADEEGMVAYFQDDQLRTPRFPGKLASQWVAMARRDADLGDIPRDPRWIRLARKPGERAWSDDFSDVISSVKW